jgi:16S rRNA (cytosine1402-N4)-methyltransferase
MDLTLGGGGHAKAILESSKPDGRLFGLDCDEEILIQTKEALKGFGDRFVAKQGNFGDAAEIFEEWTNKTNGVIMDLGLSSFQLDCASRGFSIYKDGPFDLRMDRSQPFTGKDLVNKGRKEDLLYAVGKLGEEPKAEAVVRAIIAERQKRPLLHTSDMRALVEKVYGRHGGKIHPATRTFQGLRMFVNRELDALERGLVAAFKLLTRCGRLAVISFHSGEDRIVKAFYKNRAASGEAKVLSPKPIRPGTSEVRRNRRSRSARLRFLEKQ